MINFSHISFSNFIQKIAYILEEVLKAIKLRASRPDTMFFKNSFFHTLTAEWNYLNISKKELMKFNRPELSLTRNIHDTEELKLVTQTRYRHNFQDCI